MFAQKTPRPEGSTTPPGGPDAHQLRCGRRGFIAAVRLRGGAKDTPSSVERVAQASRLFTEKTSSSAPGSNSGDGLPVARP